MSAALRDDTDVSGLPPIISTHPQPPLPLPPSDISPTACKNISLLAKAMTLKELVKASQETRALQRNTQGSLLSKIKVKTDHRSHTKTRSIVKNELITAEWLNSDAIHARQELHRNRLSPAANTKSMPNPPPPAPPPPHDKLRGPVAPSAPMPRVDDPTSIVDQDVQSSHLTFKEKLVDFLM
ncbi:hypothetical protein HDU82_007979 [Entophlyctis luteolus]|nr:hypothetical protein HDU82_007979 [Entophlyctis luteolus]